MHELAVTESVLKTAIEYAEKANASAITDIYLVIGDLSSFVNDSVQFYFDFFSKGTLAEGAQLHFERIKPKLRCRSCGQEFEMEVTDWTCPHCGAMGGDVVAGKEFFLKSIEIV